jgi:hypothetical protein
MADQHQFAAEGLTSPADNAAAVTPSDSTDLAYNSRALYVGGAGNLVVTMSGGGDVTFTAVPAGSILPIRVSRVKATSTTATSIVNLY